MSERLIDRIVAAAPTERRMIHVPDPGWECDIYFPALTKAQLEAAIPKNGDRSVTMQSLMLLVHTAQDGAGNRLFQLSDIEKLRQKADLNVLTRVEAFMWGTVVPTVEEAEDDLKNAPSLSGDSPSPAS